MSHPTHIDWHEAGTRDWDLTLSTITHDDDHPDNEAARDERDNIRAYIPNLEAEQLRDYLTAILDQMEMLLWLNAPAPRPDNTQ